MITNITKILSFIWVFFYQCLRFFQYLLQFLRLRFRVCITMSKCHMIVRVYRVSFLPRVIAVLALFKLSV